MQGNIKSGGIYVTGSVFFLLRGGGGGGGGILSLEWHLNTNQQSVLLSVDQPARNCTR